MFQLIDFIADVFLMALAIVTVPSVFIGCLAIATNRHQQGQIRMAQQSVKDKVQPPIQTDPQVHHHQIELTPSTQAQPSAPKMQSILRPIATSSETQTFADNDPLANTQKASNSKKAKTTDNKPKAKSQRKQTTETSSNTTPSIAKLLKEQWSQSKHGQQNA